MELYRHGGDIYGIPNIRLDFSVSTNPLGMPQGVRNALISRAEEYKNYPDPYCRELRAAVSRNEHVNEEFILFGSGASDLIYRICRALKPRKALVCSPSFSEYQRALKDTGCKVYFHSLRKEENFSLNEEIFGNIPNDTDVIFLCNPNNPTGVLISDKLLEDIINHAVKKGAFIVIDECFLDFVTACESAGASAKKFLNNPKIIILKAFTKTYSLAGLRLGYIMTSNLELIERVYSSGQCWNVSVPAQIAGTAAVSAEDWIDKTRDIVKKEREFLFSEFSNFGFEVFPGEANFLLFRSKKDIYEPLLGKGILIRCCDNFEGLDKTFFRIGVKNRSQNLCLTDSLKEILDG